MLSLHIEPANIIASVMTITNQDDRPNGSPLLSMFSIPFMAHGLRKCQICIPAYETDHSYHFAWFKNGDIKWMSILMPARGITHPHIDFHGASQLMIHIHGRKLWFTWPATDFNVKPLLNHELRDGNPIELLESIDVLEGLELILLNKTQEAFYLPGGMIHAAISFSTCCHAGVYLWALDEYPIAHNLVNYHLSFSAEPITGLLPSMVEYLNIFCHDFDGLELWYWDALAQANHPHKKFPDILEWIKHTREQLHSYVKIHLPAAQDLEEETMGQMRKGKKRKNQPSNSDDNGLNHRHKV